ncbi:hypothetical protein LCGC14_1676890 [marine sediment metagenome]|uniref:Uncharacterized protein n=1 Tax=marine sediment metagenome TaxID=412755 RepID=A0A0F9KPN8_9ZZZZ
MELKKISITIGIIVGLIVICGTLFTITSYFATSADVEIKVTELEKTDALIAERMDISITQDEIRWHRQQKIRIEDKIIIQTVPRKPTEAEKAAIRDKEEEIARLEKEIERKKEFYQEIRKSK